MKKETGFRPHVLRHAFALYMLFHGKDPETVRRLLGHSDWKIVKYYVKLDKRSNELTGLAINLGKAEALSNATTQNPITIATTFKQPLKTNAEAAWIETINATPLYAITNLKATTPPQASPPENATPPPTPQMVVEVTPQPNATKPTPVTIEIHIKYPGIANILNEYEVYYEIIEANEYGWPAGYTPVKSGYLELHQIPYTDEAVAILSIPGDKRYVVFISILFKDSEVEKVIVWNFKPKKW